MSTANSTIRKCRFIGCKHQTRDLDIAVEPFIKVGSVYYHEDCYKLKKSNEWKDEQTRKDLVEFRDIWWKNISKTVNFQQLMKILNEYIARGVSSDYLLFALKYIIQHKMNLNYPNGFKYYVDRIEIKQAYDKYLIKKAKAEQDSNSVNITDTDNAPKFNVQNKKHGFQSILGN